MPILNSMADGCALLGQPSKGLCSTIIWVQNIKTLEIYFALYV